MELSNNYSVIVMSQQSSFAKMKSFDDLARFIVFSQIPFLQYVELNGRHVYFIQIMGLGGGKMIYYYERDRKIEERYVVFNRFRDQLTFSSTFGTDGQSSYVPILELEKTNVFSEYPPL